MEIMVIGPASPASLPASRVQGREGGWIRFKAGDVEGTARLVSRDRDLLAGKAGSMLAVETGYDWVDSIEMATVHGGDSFREISDMGDYAVSASIIQVWPDRVVLVQARGIPLMIEVPADCPVETSNGARVVFTLHGLSLWDVNS